MFGSRRAGESHQQRHHTSAHGPTWQAAVREGLEHLPHPWHNPHEAERQSRPWRGALQRTDTAAAGRAGQWAQAPVSRAGGRPRPQHWLREEVPEEEGGCGRQCRQRCGEGKE